MQEKHKPNSDISRQPPNQSTDQDVVTGSAATMDHSDATAKSSTKATVATKEFNGPKGLEPTRYGDWESKGRCCDF